MFSHYSKSSASAGEFSATTLLAASSKSKNGLSDDENGRFSQAVDDFLDRMPAWLFHAVGVATALIGLWFALAYMGGLPAGLVEWIALAMFGAFAYALGFMVPLVLALIVQGAGRNSVLLALLAVGATLSALGLPVGA